MGAVGNEELIGGNFNAFRFEAFDLLTEANGIQHHAISNDALLSPKDARGDEVKDVFFALGDHGMTGVISALSTDNEVSFFGQEIDDFSLSFIAPLEATDNGVHLKIWVKLFCGFDEPGKFAEEILGVVGSRSSFRVMLHRENGILGATDAFDRLVVQINVGHFGVGRE